MGCACVRSTSNIIETNKRLSIKDIQSIVKNSKHNIGKNILSVEALDEFKKKKISIKPFLQKKNYLYIISPQNWLKVIDFLNFKELIESGKMNRYLK